MAAKGQRPAPAGTGLDAALADPPGGLIPDPLGALGNLPPQKRERGRSRSRKGKKGLADKLQRQEKELAELKSKEDEAKRKKKKKKKKRKKKKERKASTSSEDEASSRSSSSSSVPDFQSSSARGGDIRRLAEKKPGRLTELALKEMSRYLAGNAEVGLDKEAWKSQRVLAYLNQIVLTNYPPSRIGVRPHRELATLATALDRLLKSEYLQCLDLLMQRLKALEASLQDGGWHVARHFELIPAAAAQLSALGEREPATKAEMRDQKLKEALHKAQKPSK